MSIAIQLTDKSKFKDLVVLIVDDSKTSAVLIRQQIIAFGTPYDNIDTAYSYQDAIKHVENRFYDVIIIDYHLEQCINGNELAILLNKRKLISSQTGVILVSGDTRQETVLTVLSGEIQYLIKKPVQIYALGIKVLSVCEDKKAVNFAQLLIKDDALNDIYKKLRLVALIENSPSPVIVESAIFDLTVKKQQWLLLSSLLSHSVTNLHMSKACAFGQLYCYQGNISEAISFLEAFLSENPLAHQVMDILAEIFSENEHHNDALN
ncbi:MAG: response regulator [Alteromonadales bacterium]|nr:response regulator [Alteromonadales bacterium]